MKRRLGLGPIQSPTPITATKAIEAAVRVSESQHDANQTTLLRVVVKVYSTLRVSASLLPNPADSSSHGCFHCLILCSPSHSHQISHLWTLTLWRQMGFDTESLLEATSGAVGALVSTTILYPLDTCKTKYQAEVSGHHQQKYRFVYWPVRWFLSFLP